MCLKVMVFILKVLSGSDPGYWMPPLPVCRESTVTTVMFANTQLGTTSDKDTTAGDFTLKSCRRHSNAHRSNISHPARANEEKLSASHLKPKHQRVIPK